MDLPPDADTTSDLPLDIEALLRRITEELSVDGVPRGTVELLSRLPDAALVRLKKLLDLQDVDRCEEGDAIGGYGSIIGHSAAIDNLVEQIDLVASTDASVLVLGESGTGKELVAQEIHTRSRRRDHPLVKVNCASIPRELYESEFFGHVRGAFTGALRDRAGRFELADRGTLFLDEVAEIPYHLQGKLLRVLQEHEFERVGEEVTRRADVRIVAATNCDLKRVMEAGRFRRDLFYRLAVFPIEVAPLRQRKDDIPLLAAHFLRQVAAGLDRPAPRLTQADLIQLQQYDWPGNVRELRNVMERAAITARGGVLRLDLPHDTDLPRDDKPQPESPAAQPREVISDAEMRRREHDNLLAALERSQGKIYGPGGAAELLGMRPTTLASRLKRQGLLKFAPRRTNEPR
jgi:transcriptional regulator with GAF, ATPase, and Fis domain